jgi:CheY-like chemotaxis protein
MSEQNVVEAPSHNAAGDFEGDFGNEDFGNSEPSGSSNGQPPPGMGQSKSSRRRRRKRRNKMLASDSPETSGGESESSPTPIIMEGESLSLLAAAPQPRKQQQQGGGQQQPGQGQGKRWKKKFRDRERRQRNPENPGNDFRSDNNGGGGHRQDFRPDNFGNTNGHFKRKGKGQQKERGFVGPMDHSYREVNGNGDGPPSTISVHAHGGRRGGHRHHGDNQPIDYNMPRPIPIPEGAQTHIYFFIEELFFVAKIQETAKKLGVKVAFVKNDKDAIDTMMESEQDKPALIVFDLNNANAKPLTLIPRLKAKLKKSASIIGFLSHIQGDLKAKAVEAGCDVVMPRSAFSQGLPNLLRRYGAEEEEEINYNH